MQVTDEMIEKAKAELFKSGMVDVFSVRAALTAAISDQERAVEVKGLDWRVFCSRSGNCEAKTPFGEYVIQSERDGWMLYLLNEQDAHMAYSTIDYAKSAAQSDYEQRIRSALVDVPVEPVGEVGELPGSNGGFTMAVFKASDVPLGTKIYASPPLPHREGEDSAEVYPPERG